MDYMNKIYIPKKCKFSGVYVLMNLNNKKCYVGSSANLSARFAQHKSLLKSGNERVKEMQEDFNKGHDFLFYPVLEFHPIFDKKWMNKSDLVALENQTMNYLDSINSGYNKKQDLVLRTHYQRDIFYSKIYLSEMADFISGSIDSAPHINLHSGRMIEYS